jgi:Protein of unknown function (DUF1569)
MKSLIRQADKDSLIARINQLKPESKAVWGKMNANQMVCHLTDQLRHSMNEKENPSVSNLFFRTFGKWLVLYILPIPKNVKTSPKADQMQDGTKPTNFENDKETLLFYLEKMSSLSEDFSWAAHFRFGTMNKKEWSVFTYKHFDHHLKQFGV